MQDSWGMISQLPPNFVPRSYLEFTMGDEGVS